MKGNWLPRVSIIVPLVWAVVVAAMAVMPMDSPLPQCQDMISALQYASNAGFENLATDCPTQVTWAVGIAFIAALSIGAALIAYQHDYRWLQQQRGPFFVFVLALLAGSLLFLTASPVQALGLAQDPPPPDSVPLPLAILGWIAIFFILLGLLAGSVAIWIQIKRIFGITERLSNKPRR